MLSKDSISFPKRFLKEAFLHIFDTKESTWSDFIVDNKFTFEIGGKNKNKKQITRISDAYIAADGIQFGHDIKIPLWLFGFLY